MDGRTVKQTNARTDEPTYGGTNERTGRTERGTDRRTNEHTNGRTDARTDIRKRVCEARRKLEKKSLQAILLLLPSFSFLLPSHILPPALEG